MSRVLKLNERNFDQEVSQSEVPVLVEFSASWCVPSQQQKPVLESLAGEYAGKLKIGNINVDQNAGAASRYKIMGCPTFIVFNSGKLLSRRTGAQSKKQLEEMIQGAVSGEQDKET